MVSKTLEKLPRGADEDFAIEDKLQVLSSTEGPEDVIANITDPTDPPGSILTTLIDGFLLQKVEEPADKTASSIALDHDKEENAGGFPVTNILSGIYNLVSSYINDDTEPDEEEPITGMLHLRTLVKRG